MTNTTNNKITGVTVISHNSLSDKFSKTFLRLPHGDNLLSAHCVNRRVYSSRRISKFLSDTTAFTAIIWNQYLYEEAWIRIG